jgi:hypothetical protein
MSKELTKSDQKGFDGGVPKKYPRHPITMENTPEETIRIMQSLPQRAARIRELIRALRETNSR